MRKSFTLFATVCLLIFVMTVSVRAQFGSKNQIEVGGAISYSSITQVAAGETDKNSTSIFEFMPYVGYFVTKGFSIGISPGINSIKPAGSDNAVTNLMLFAIPGYTFSTKGDVFPFLQAWIGYTSITSDSNPISGSTAKMENTGISYGGRGGVKIQVGKGGLCAIGVSYMMYTFNEKGASKRSGMNTLAITIGFSVFME